VSKSWENQIAAEEALKLIRQGQTHEQEAGWHEQEAQKYTDQKNTCYETALALLSMAFAAPLARFCDNLMQDDTGEDKAQEALIAAYNAMSQLRAKRDIGSLESWLFTIAKNLCLKALRKQRRVRKINKPTARRLAALPNLPSNPSRRVKRHTRWRNIPEPVLKQAIDLLDKDTDKIIIRMNMDESFKSIKDIANFVGVKESTVRKRIQRAADRIDAILGL
jgi:RNA polymerase sigma factor (sigma-70 family)